MRRSPAHVTLEPLGKRYKRALDSLIFENPKYLNCTKITIEHQVGLVT